MPRIYRRWWQWVCISPYLGRGLKYLRYMTKIKHITALTRSLPRHCAGSRSNGIMEWQSIALHISFILSSTNSHSLDSFFFFLHIVTIFSYSFSSSPNIFYIFIYFPSCIDPQLFRVSLYLILHSDLYFKCLPKLIVEPHLFH